MTAIINANNSDYSAVSEQCCLFVDITKFSIVYCTCMSLPVGCWLVFQQLNKRYLD